MTNDLFDLSGRVALVTGGGRGLGKAMAQILAEHGASLVLAARTEAELKSTADEITKATGARVATVPTDMTRRDDVRRLADAAFAAFGQVDILINNAGSNKVQTIDQIRDEDWDRLLELNLSSCMALTRAVAPQMKERRWGRIIFISSVMAVISKSGRNAYSTTKSALFGLANASALDLGPYGVTVNCIAPGPFMTDLPMGMLTEAEKDQFARRTALGRWGQPRELAGAALLLASPAGSYITGSVLVVDGGTLINGF